MNNDQSLAHYGVPGMKWGVRKARRPSSDDYKSTASLRKRKPSELSNEELKKVITRLQLEKQYKELSPSTISSGKKFATGLLKEVGREMVKDYLKTGVKAGVKALNELLNEKR